jgi:HK97 family phage major capsid protein
MIDTFPLDAVESSRRRALGLMADTGAGPSLLQHIRDLTLGGDGGPQRRRVAMSALQTRDLNAASSTAGGYMTGTTMLGLEALLKRYNIVGEAGCSFTPPLDSAAVIPRVATRPDAAWLSAEGQTITQSEPTLGQASVAPKYLAIRVRCSRQLILQANAESLIQEVCGDAVGRGSGVALFSGTGSSGQPMGLLNTAGRFVQSGTSLGLSGLLAMREAALLAGARESRLQWFGHPDTQKLLATRERNAGGGRNLWDDEGILGLKATATADVPSGTLVLMDPSLVTIAQFSGGLSIESDPFSDFASGRVSFRMILPIDFAFSPIASFATATSIT